MIFGLTPQSPTINPSHIPTTCQKCYISRWIINSHISGAWWRIPPNVVLNRYIYQLECSTLSASVMTWHFMVLDTFPPSRNSHNVRFAFRGHNARFLSSFVWFTITHHTHETYSYNANYIHRRCTHIIDNSNNYAVQPNKRTWHLPIILTQCRREIWWCAVWAPRLELLELFEGRRTNK